jgi:hypothetical protein
MKQLTFKEFRKNGTYILAVGEEQKSIRTAWLKRNNYEYLEYGSMGNELKCHDGGLTTVLGLNKHDLSQKMEIYSVYQLEGWDEPTVKEMTIAEISKLVGCEVKIIK